MNGLSGRVQHNESVDALKGIAIIFVMLLHALPRQALLDSYALLHIWQAVPILLVLLGYTGVLTRVRPLSHYYRRRALRLLVPLVAVWVVALVIALVRSDLAWSPLLLAGKLPATGPGNYFITLVLQFALILPLLRWLLARGAFAFIATCFAVNLAYELAVWHFDWDGYLYSSSILRVLFTVGLGMLIASDRRVEYLFPFSLVYLIAMLQQWRLPFFIDHWQTQALFAAGYAATLVSLGLRLRYPALSGVVGRASYHVFLVQILWFGQIGPAVMPLLSLRGYAGDAFQVLVCIVLGVAFAKAEQRLMARFTRAGEPRPELLEVR